MFSKDICIMLSRVFKAICYLYLYIIVNFNCNHVYFILCIKNITLKRSIGIARLSQRSMIQIKVAKTCPKGTFTENLKLFPQDPKIFKTLFFWEELICDNDFLISSYLPSLYLVHWIPDKQYIHSKYL